MRVEQRDRRVLLEPDEAEEDAAAGTSSPGSAACRSPRRRRAASRGSGSARARSRRSAANAVANSAAPVQMISAVDEVALEVDGPPHLAEGVEASGAGGRRSPVASCRSSAATRATSQKIGASITPATKLGERVERAVASRCGRGGASCGGLQVAAEGAVPDATQIEHGEHQQREAAAPKPNRLFENDWRTISVIIRSASGPGSSRASRRGSRTGRRCRSRRTAAGSRSAGAAAAA